MFPPVLTGFSTARRWELATGTRVEELRFCISRVNAARMKLRSQNEMKW